MIQDRDLGYSISANYMWIKNYPYIICIYILPNLVSHISEKTKPWMQFQALWTKAANFALHFCILSHVPPCTTAYCALAPPALNARTWLMLTTLQHLILILILLRGSVAPSMVCNTCLDFTKGNAVEYFSGQIHAHSQYSSFTGYTFIIIIKSK